MDWEVRGLPVHVLLVHALVVLVPTAAGAVVLASWWPAARRRLGWLPAALAVLALALTPVTTAAGEWLRDRLPRAPLIAEHTELGDQLLPWVGGLAVVAVASALVGQRGSGRTVRLLVALLATAVAVGATVQTVRVGESGARAVWEGSVAS